MFEYYGWVIIFDSVWCEDLDEDFVLVMVDVVRIVIVEVFMEGVMTFELCNVLWFLTIMGFNNYCNLGVVWFFEVVVRLVLGSYGMLYMYDDEVNFWRGCDLYFDEVGESVERWYCCVMKCGCVECYDDVFLLLHIGVVEDECLL